MTNEKLYLSSNRIPDKTEANLHSIVFVGLVEKTEMYWVFLSSAIVTRKSAKEG